MSTPIKFPSPENEAVILSSGNHFGEREGVDWGIDWRCKLYDEEGAEHQLIAFGGVQVVTRVTFAYVIWNRMDGRCLSHPDGKISNTPLTDLEKQKRTVEILEVLRSTPTPVSPASQALADVAEEESFPVVEIEYTVEQRDRVASLFVEYLLRDLGPEKYDEMVRLNAEEPDRTICHSHDFIDANMTMQEAFRDVMGVDPDVRSNTQAALWDEAWGLAKTEMKASLALVEAQGPAGIASAPTSDELLAKATTALVDLQRGYRPAEILAHSGVGVSTLIRELVQHQRKKGYDDEGGWDVEGTKDILVARSATLSSPQA